MDKDPVVLAHAHQLVRSTPEGAADYIHADLRDPETILRDAAATLDFAHPMGLILVGVLHSIPDEDNPCAIVTGLLDAVCVGSYMALTHLARDVHPEMAEAMRRANETMTDPFVLRSRTEVARFLGGLETLEPGIVTVDRWQPDDTKIRPAEDPEVAVYCAIGRKQ